MSYEQLADAVTVLVASNTSLKNAATEAVTRSNEVLDEAQTAIGQSSQAANNAVMRAETARDAVLLSKNIKDTTAQGLASTGNGEYFSTPSPDSSEYLILYKNNAGVAAEIKRYPNAAVVLASRLTSGELFSMVGTFMQAFNGATLIKGADSRNIGVSIPAGSSGATSVLRVELGLQKDIDKLVGGIVQIDLRYDATTGFLTANPANAALRLQVRRGGSLVSVAPTTASEVQVGAEVVKSMTYTVLPGDQDLSPVLSLNNTSTTADRSITLKSVSYKLISQPVNFDSWSDTHLDIRTRLMKEQIAGNTLTSGELMALPLFAWNGQVFNGGAKILDNGHMVGVTIPSGSGGGDSFVAPYVAVNGQKLAGATLSITAVFDVTANFVTECPSNTIKAQVNRNGVTSVATVSNVKEIQVGTVLTKTFDYVITATDNGLAPTYQIATSAAALGHVRSIQIKSLKYTLSNLPAGQVAADVMMGVQLAASLEALPIEGVPRILSVAPSGGQYATPALANVAAANAAKSSPVNIIIAPGEYDDDNSWLLKNWANLIGSGRERVLLAYALPPDAVPLTIQQTQTLYVNENSRLEGLKITAKNIRYPVHSDSNGIVRDQVIRIIDCWIEHLGNQEAQAYQDSIQSGVTVWASTHAWGCGTSSGQKIYATDSVFKSPTTAFYFHTNAFFEKPCYVLLENNTLITTNDNGNAVSVQALGSFQRDKLEMKGNMLFGDIRYNPANPWMPSDLASQPANHAEIEVFGYGNSPSVFNVVETGRALKIESNTAGATSSIAVTGTAVSVIFGEQVYTLPGAVGGKGYVYGWADISGVGVGSPNVGNITSLGKRLGNCITANKTLSVSINGAAPIAVVFNQDYTNQTNTTILTTINAALGSAAVASEYNIGGRYRPSFHDEEMTLKNTSGVWIPMGSAVVYDNHRKHIRLMTATDNPTLFAGITWQDIYPDDLGRIKTCGYLPTTDLLRTEQTALTYNQQLYIDPAVPGQLTTTVGANPIMRAIRPDAVEVNKK